MAAKIKAGDKLPMFSYDTPYRAQNRFRDLLAAQAPLVLVFMANFGDPHLCKPLCGNLRQAVQRRVCYGGAFACR